MKKENNFFKKNREALNTRSARIGGYSFVIAIFALAILIVVNIFASSLPSKLTQFDISAQRLYSVTSNTKAVVQNLEKDVTVYWIVQNGKEDTTIEKLLDVYNGLSDHVTIQKMDPDVNPTFASQYTSDTVNNNSLVVECGDKFRYIDYNSIYDKDESNYYSTGSVSYSFDGEGEITSAVNYVSADTQPQIYMTTGHGEAEISSSFTSSIERANLETQSFSLLNVDAVPEDAALVMINAPKSDFSEEEVNMLKDYVAAGGKLMVIAGPQDGDDITNLKALMTGYGVSFTDGIVLEGDRNYYGFSYPYILIPEIQDTEITSALISENSFVLVPLAQGMTIDATASDATVTSLLNTSDTAFSKVDGYDMSTSEKEEGDIDGGFSVAVSVREADSEGQVVWISSDTILDDQMVSYSSGANTDFVMNSISWMVGDNSGVAIASKSMDYTYLTINASQANVIRIVMLAIIPLIYLGYGLNEVIARRKNK